MEHLLTDIASPFTAHGFSRAYPHPLSCRIQSEQNGVRSAQFAHPTATTTAEQGVCVMLSGLKHFYPLDR